MTGMTLFNRLSLVIGFAFLYLPIIILVIYSFNASKLVTVWAGFSTKWYYELFRDQGLMDATKVTLIVAVASSTLATILGVMSGLALARYGNFRGRTLFSGMVIAPIVMPEVILGLALLLSFVAISLDRGFLTVILAHTTFAMCYVTTVVRARLAGFDASVEEAAMDLGATPFTVFWRITLPLILPAVISGWLLAFTLSLDDLVLASFTSGPGSTTLPMKIFSAVRLGVSPEINAICTLLIGVIATGVFTANWVQSRAEKRRIAEERAAARAG